MAKVTVSEWVRKSEGRIQAVIQQSAQDVIEEATRTRAKGGNLPLDTGFLRASGLAQIGSMPSGPGDQSEGRGSGSDNQVSLTINRVKPGDVLYYGFSANYARYMEARFSFVRLAAQNWQQIVKRNADKLRRMSDGN